MLADVITPVSIYLKAREAFPNSILLESSDYHGNENSFSYVCCNPISSIKVQNDVIERIFPDGHKSSEKITKEMDIPNEIHKFSQKFDADEQKFKFINNGLFGYINYDAVQYFEDI